MHKTKFVDSNLKFAKQMTKKQHSEFDDRIRIVHRICKSQFTHKTEFVSHKLVHKTEFVSHNLKFTYEMTMEFND